MFRLCILMYGLSLTEAYTIKLSGTVELGNQLSKLFKEMYSQMAEHGYFPDQVISLQESLVPAEEQPQPEQKNYEQAPSIKHAQGEYDYEKSEEKQRKSKGKKAKDMPILDKMMQNDMQKLHLYGLHKVDDRKNDGPLNNINI